MSPPPEVKKTRRFADNCAWEKQALTGRVLYARTVNALLLKEFAAWLESVVRDG